MLCTNAITIHHRLGPQSSEEMHTPITQTLIRAIVAPSVMLSFIRSWHDAADRLNDPREILDLDLGIGLPGLNFELKEALDSKR